MSGILSKIQDSIKSFISRLSFKDWLIVLLLLTALCLGISSKHYRNKSEKVIVLNDSIHKYKNKLDEEYVAKNTYIQTIDELKKNNSELYDEVKSLRDNPIVVTKIKHEIRIDTVFAESDTIVDIPDTYRKNLIWHADNDYYTMRGYTWVECDFSKFGTVLTDVRIPANMTVDVIEQKDGTMKIIGKTDNPYVNICNIDGVVINPTKSKAISSQFRQKRFSIGPHIGIGVNPDLKFTPYIGIGVSYGIINF